MTRAVRNYVGSCHCGAVRFVVATSIESVRECDCSVCVRRGGLMLRVSRNALRLLTSPEALTIYRWGSGTAADCFCSTCGILPFRQPSRLTAEEQAQGMKPFEGWSINARCLDGLDLEAIPRVRVCGSRLVI